MRLHCKEHGYMDEKTGPTAECPYCRIEELEADLEISKRLNTSKGLRDFLKHEDHKIKLHKIRGDQHVKSYKLERDELREQNKKYREALQQIERGVMCYTNLEIRSMVKEALGL